MLMSAFLIYLFCPVLSGTIGHVDHGKTTLTAAITRVLGDSSLIFPPLSYFLTLLSLQPNKEVLRLSATKKLTKHLVSSSYYSIIS